MEIKGKLIQKLPAINGEGKNGPWAKASFVIETVETYPKKVCFLAWNDKIPFIESVQENEAITVHFDVESREFNGKWYTDLKMWKVERGSASVLPVSPPDDINVGGEPPDIGPFNNSGEVADDLPF